MKMVLHVAAVAMCLITLLFTLDSFYKGYYNFIVCSSEYTVFLINRIGMMPSLLETTEKTTEKSTSMVKININEKLCSFNTHWLIITIGCRILKEISFYKAMQLLK